MGQGVFSAGSWSRYRPVPEISLVSIMYFLTNWVEVVGKAIKVGPKVSLIKEGQRVGVGAQCYACLACRQCRSGNEAYCKHQVDTYGSVWPDTGLVSQGGFSSHMRTHEHWSVSQFLFRDLVLYVCMVSTIFISS